MNSQALQTSTDQDVPNNHAHDAASPEDVMSRIGQMTRALHENLQGLGFDRLLEKASQDIPDARERLNYVAKMTEKAAERVLNATDIASPLQSDISSGAMRLEKQWQEILSTTSFKRDYNLVADETLAYLQSTIRNSELTKEQLMEIMMAQDFQDLTGQVIKKVTELAQGLEQQLVQLLIDFTPSSHKRDAGNGLMNGPQIDPGNTPEVVADQQQVDDLLDSLGF